jgi:hypothetical protein
MPVDQFRESDNSLEQNNSRVTRRRIVATGAKLAYSAPLVAASFALTGEGALATDCPCPSGTLPIPEHIFKEWWFKAFFSHLIGLLRGKCIGCKFGQLKLGGSWYNLCYYYSRKEHYKVCPGSGNKIVLHDRTRVSH